MFLDHWAFTLHRLKMSQISGYCLTLLVLYTTVIIPFVIHGFLCSARKFNVQKLAQMSSV